LPTPSQGLLPACGSTLWPDGIRTRWTDTPNFRTLPITFIPSDQPCLVASIDYPIADTVIDTMVSPTTWTSIWIKDGKIVERELEHISADGKTFREIDEGKDEKGRRYRNYLVFERP